jgi:hypothetical protein
VRDVHVTLERAIEGQATVDLSCGLGREARGTYFARAVVGVGRAVFELTRGAGGRLLEVPDSAVAAVPDRGGALAVGGARVVVVHVDGVARRGGVDARDLDPDIGGARFVPQLDLVGEHGLVVGVHEAQVLPGVLGPGVVDAGAVELDQHGEVVEVLGLAGVVEGDPPAAAPGGVPPRPSRRTRVVRAVPEGHEGVALADVVDARVRAHLEAQQAQVLDAVGGDGVAEVGRRIAGHGRRALDGVTATPREGLDDDVARRQAGQVNRAVVHAVAGVGTDGRGPRDRVPGRVMVGGPWGVEVVGRAGGGDGEAVGVE